MILNNIQKFITIIYCCLLLLFTFDLHHTINIPHGKITEFIKTLKI